MPSLTTLSEIERTIALQRFHIIQPFIDGECTLKSIAAQHEKISYRTMRRWVKHYRTNGLVGLVRRKRTDKGQRRINSQLELLIEGLALQKNRPTAASIYRQIQPIVQQHNWQMPSYTTVYNIVRALDDGLVLLAHNGSKAYQQSFDLLYRREASQPNEIWQADHSLLDIWLIDENGNPNRPWLTVIQDDYSRCVAGYYLTFDHPNTHSTSLALRQAIWRKVEPTWRICGIPETFYTDNGSDFTSKHLEQVSADLKMRLVFSTPGMPRGRGRIERFFQTVNQLFLHLQPGYAVDGKPVTPPKLTLVELDQKFKQFLLTTYHVTIQTELDGTPQQRWEYQQFVPHLPESLEQLDLLLLTVAKTRKVRRDGIHFQRLRYMDTLLAAYIGEEVIIRYDPRDMAEIRVYLNDHFLCRAVCQEIAHLTISLQEIIRARNRRRRELREVITDRADLVARYISVHSETASPDSEIASSTETNPPKQRLKRYRNE